MPEYQGFKFTSIQSKITGFIAMIIASIAVTYCIIYFALISISTDKLLNLMSSHIEQTIVNKGINLVTNNSLALREMVQDNAFNAVDELVSSTVLGDQDIAGGFFVSDTDTPWSSQNSLDYKDPYIFLADRKIHDAVKKKNLSFFEITINGSRLFVFNSPVFDDSDFLGSIVYIFNDKSILTESKKIKALFSSASVKQISFIIAFSVVILILAIYVARSLTSRVTRPLNKLIQSAEAITSGDYEHEIKSKGNDEVSVLAQRFETMRQTVRDHTQNLEILVEERTRELNQTLKRVYSLNQQLEELSITDPLTGVLNRRKFDTDFETKCANAMAEKSRLALAFCDIDHFKSFNDNYGHQLGDFVIQQVAVTIKQCISEDRNSFCYRYGGEEFCILSSKVEIADYLAMIEKVQQGIRNLKITSGKKVLSVTASFGINILEPGYNQIPEEFIKTADNALYQAKEDGRDRVVLAEKITPPVYSSET